MPSFVITASVYVDDVATPEEATAAVEAVNRRYADAFSTQQLEIRLLDDHNNPEILGSKWEALS